MNNYTGRHFLDRRSFPNVFGGLNPNPTSELLHHVRFSGNPNLKVQKTLFFAIFGLQLLNL